MRQTMHRRRFLATSVATVTVGKALIPCPSVRADTPTLSAGQPPLRIGLMTYLLAAKWDLDTVIRRCREAQFEHVELRTTHAHGVEVTLSKAERAKVRKKFEDAGLKLSLASGFSYHWPDPKKLRANIEGTKQYAILAHDIGAIGIRVFPNAILVDQGIREEKTLAQIGRALAEVGEFAANLGVEIRVSNHGKGTNRITQTKKILDYADSPHVYVNWNCDPTDVETPGFEANFRLVRDRIRNVHMHDLYNPSYPYRKLFALLRAAKYQGYCDAEVGPSCEPETFMKYYRALFLALQNAI